MPVFFVVAPSWHFFSSRSKKDSIFASKTWQNERQRDKIETKFCRRHRIPLSMVDTVTLSVVYYLGPKVKPLRDFSMFTCRVTFWFRLVEKKHYLEGCSRDKVCTPWRKLRGNWFKSRGTNISGIHCNLLNKTFRFFQNSLSVQCFWRLPLDCNIGCPNINLRFVSIGIFSVQMQF